MVIYRQNKNLKSHPRRLLRYLFLKTPKPPTQRTVVLRVSAFVLILMAIKNLKEEKKNSRRRKAENLSRRKKTVLKKVYELGEYDGVDVALIICQNGRFFT
jgi:hypothetical protein